MTTIGKDVGGWAPGQAFLLKLGDGSRDNPHFTTVAGLRATGLSVNGDAVAVTKKNGGWRELLSGAGVRSVSIVGSGIFIGSSAEQTVRERALQGSVDDYELSFESGEKMRGRFLITRLEYTGDFNGERNYSIALESSGEVVSA